MKASLPRTSFIHLLRKSSRESSVYTTLSHAHRLRVQVSCSLCASWAVMRILQVCPVSGPWLVLSLLLLNCCHFVQGKTWCPCHILGPRSTGCTCCRAKGAGSKGAYSISRVKITPQVVQISLHTGHHIFATFRSSSVPAGRQKVASWYSSSAQ